MAERPDIVWLIGASGTIGQAIERRLAEAGGIVVSSSRGIAERQDAAASSLAVDVTDAASVEAAAEAILHRFGRLDALVFSVAAPVFGPFADLTDEDWLSVIDTKLLGAVRAIRRVLPIMKGEGRGRIVLVTGRGAAPPPHHLPGAAVNAALNLIVQGLGGGEEGIAINAVAPGPVVSPRLEAMRGAGARPVEALDPSEIADAVAFLLSDAARGVSGATLVVDRGGRRSFGP